MPALKPITKLDVIGNLALNPEKSVHNLTESKLQNKLFIKPPKWDSPGDGVELWALQIEREHFGMLQVQQELREHAYHQDIINTNRIADLKNVHSNSRQHFIEANNFFKDCDDKKKTAEAKVLEEKLVHADLKKAIQDHRENIHILTEFENALRKTVKEFETYETVIQGVVQSKDIWHSIKDCINSCDALMMTQVEINEMKEETLERIETLRQNMLKLTNEAGLTLLGLNNELAELERAYSYAHSECLKWEKIIVNIKECLIANSLLTNTLVDEIYITYRILCKRRGFTPIIKKEDIEQQLDFIRVELDIIQNVLIECNKTLSTKR